MYLLTSPVNSPPRTKKTTGRPSTAASPYNGLSKVGLDDFRFSDFSDDLDFSSAQPKKKQRLSPPDTKPSKAKSSQGLSFLSSDDFDDVLPSQHNRTVRATVVELSSDPITFSSSAPEQRTARQGPRSAIVVNEANDSGKDDVFSFSQPSASTRTYLSERTANLLANIRGPKEQSSKYKTFAYAVAGNAVTASTASSKTAEISNAEDHIYTSSPPQPQTRRKPSKPPVKDKAAHGAERAAIQAKKEEKKEIERARKRLAKEQKAREKQLAADVAEVNKSKTDKKKSTPEMIVDMARSLEGTSVGNQVLEYMKILGVETTFFDDPLGFSGSSAMVNQTGDLVRWRRKVKAKYNEEIGHWEPIPVEKVEIEKHILLYITAENFFEIATSGLSLSEEPALQEKAMTENLDSHVASLRSQYKDCKLIYLIEGLSTFLRKHKNAKNRAYAAAIRSQITETAQSLPPPSSQARRKRNTQNTPAANLSLIDEDLAETLLLHLQLRTRILIHQCATPSLSAEWIKSFTEHISTIPYRHIRMTANDAVGFCMDVGQVKTGDDRSDTYVKMLQEVQRVTPAMAYGIANQYDTVGKLMRAFREDGPLVLQDIRKSANRDGAVSERTLGQAVSRRLYKVWMGKDPASTDGIA